MVTNNSPSNNVSGKLNQLAVNEEGFIFNPITGESFTVNPTGLFVLQGLKKALTMQDIAANLTEEFEVSNEQAERDISDFISHLQIYKLV